MTTSPKTIIARYICTTTFVFICLTLSADAVAGTYWVSPTGAAAWSSCTGSTPLSGTSACSVATANANAAAGNLVYFRAGTYSSVTLQPANSGTSASNRITFQAYTGETPTFSGGSPDVELSGVNYVVINGFTFSNTTTIEMRIENGSSYDEIADNTFTNTAGGAGLAAWAIYMTGAANSEWVTNDWIHGNTFNLSGQSDGSGGLGCTDGGGDTMVLGQSYGAFSNTVENDNNNTIENNVFAHSPHGNIESFGMYNVFRNNVHHNEPWSSGCTEEGGSSYNVYTYSSSNPNYSSYNGSFGHRNWQVCDDYTRPATYNFIEGDRWGFAGVNQANDGADNLSLCAPWTIIRYVFSYASMNPGLLFKYGWNNGNGHGGNGASYSHVFNNTFYQNGYGYPWALSYGAANCDLSTCPWPETAISEYQANATTGVVLKNNIFSQSAGYTTFGWDVANKGTPSNGWGQINTASHNWCSGAQTGGSTDANGNTGCSGSGNPQFNNPDLSNPSSTTLPDLTETSSSPTIDGGTYLTTAVNSGSSSTSLYVADAGYFQDGTSGSALATASAGLGGTFQADCISIATVTNNVCISSINHVVSTSTTSNTVPSNFPTSLMFTVQAGLSYASGAPVSIQSPSAPTVFLLGTITSYNSSTGSLGVSVTSSPGAGTGAYTSWVIATNAITLASAATWSGGAPIWLYSKSDGTQVLYGSAPDYGASEYAGSSSTKTVAAPTNLQVVVH